MKRSVVSPGVSFAAVLFLFAAASIPARAQSHGLLQGTEVRLRLITGLNTAVYIVERKGKEVDLPAQTTIRVRMDNTVSLSRFTADNGKRELGKADSE